MCWHYRRQEGADESGPPGDARVDSRNSPVEITPALGRAGWRITKKLIRIGNIFGLRAIYLHDHHPAPNAFQHFHDVCLVRPPEVSLRAAVQGHRYKLADCVCAPPLSEVG